jgi:thiamine-phosphate pyrophosphorylase
MKSYLITDPAYYHTLSDFQSYLQNIYRKHHPDIACFRDKINSNIIPYAKYFLTISKEQNIPLILINHSVSLALSLGFDGVHLTSSQFDEIVYAKEQGLYVFISTHSLFEAREAQKLGADAVTFSPVFKSPGKGEPKGTASLKEVVDQLDKIEVYALGGIVSEKEIKALQDTNIDGFASIRYFI